MPDVWPSPCPNHLPLQSLLISISGVLRSRKSFDLDKQRRTVLCGELAGQGCCRRGTKCGRVARLVISRQDARLQHRRQCGGFVYHRDGHTEKGSNGLGQLQETRGRHKDPLRACEVALVVTRQQVLGVGVGEDTSSGWVADASGRRVAHVRDDGLAQVHTITASGRHRHLGHGYDHLNVPTAEAQATVEEAVQGRQDLELRPLGHHTPVLLHIPGGP
eukprot:56508-Eustigmatos_ZCMA.PRE.3